VNNNSLQAVQATLEERGVRDVKFFFVPEMKSMALSDAKDMMARVLEGCLRSDKTKYAGVGDRKFAE
jgi:hypothetical protein